MADPASVATESVVGDAQFADLLEELTDRLQSKRAVDFDDYLTRYPQYRETLEELVPALQTLVGLEQGPNDEDIHLSESPAPTSAGTSQGQLGDFQILREIGRGGMGVVYEAEQISLNRRVALKVLPFAGILDDQALKRFKNEALAAVSLDHANIVNVLFVGCDRGVHYYAMRFIDGQTLADLIAGLRSSDNRVSKDAKPATEPFRPISSALAPLNIAPPDDVDENEAPGCDDVSMNLPAAPDTRRELQAAVSTVPSMGTGARYRTVAELGIQAAAALDHAHANGILHRDIKPGNLMLDGQGKLWVTDFGLARIEANAAMTVTGDILGTLRYMSPESAAGGRERLVLDQRADIYSLGVTLYEMLTLEPAFDGKDRKELFQKIIFTEPRSPRRIQPTIPPSLETIVLKAIRKDPADRYATAGELADDLQRFLNDEPIEARRPTLFERTRMWSRRNRTLVAAVAILLAVVATGSAVAAGLIWQEERRTAAALRESRANEQKAAQNFAENKAIVDFLINDLLGSAAPRRPRDKPLTVVEVLDAAEAKIGSAFQDQPRAEAHIRHTIGKTYHALGRYELAENHLRRALLLDDRLHGNGHVNTLTAMNDLVNALQAQSKHKEARELLEQVLEIRRRTLNDEHPAVLQSMSNLALLLFREGKWERARRLNEQVLEIQRRTLGPEDRRTLISMNNLASVLDKQGKSDEAANIFEQILEIQRQTLGEDHLNTLRTMLNLANVLNKQFEFDDASALFEEAMDPLQRLLGAEHPTTLWASACLASLRKRQGMLGEARTIFERVVEVERRVRGLRHRETLRHMNNLASVLTAQGKSDAARVLYEQVFDVRRETLGPEHPDTLGAKHNVAVILQEQGAPDDARVLLEEILEVQRTTLGEEHPDTLMSKTNLANALKDEGSFEEASSLHEEVLETRRRTLGPEHPDTLGSINNLAIVMQNQGKFEKARALHEQSIRLKQVSLGHEHPSTLNSMHNLANVLRHQGNLDAARKLHEEVLEVRRRVIGPEHPNTLKSILCLAPVLCEQNNYDEASGPLEQALEAGRRTVGPEHPLTLALMIELARVRLGQGELGAALKLAKQSLEEDVHGPSHPSALAKQDTLAEILERLGDWVEARALREKIVELSRHQEHRPGDRAAWIRSLALNIASMTDLPQDDRRRAIELAQQATELAPDDALSWRSLGVAYAVAGHWQESREMLERALQLGCRDELLPTPVLQRIDQTENLENQRFQELMSLVHQQQPEPDLPEGRRRE